MRAGQLKDAEDALVGFQVRHPQSLRRGRAWLLLGAVRVNRGDRTGAIQCLAAAAADRDPAIAAAARTQLATLRAVP